MISHADEAPNSEVNDKSCKYNDLEASSSAKDGAASIREKVSSSEGGDAAADLCETSFGTRTGSDCGSRRYADESKKCPDEDDSEDSSPEDCAVKHAVVMSAVDEVKILARALVVCAGKSTLSISPVRDKRLSLAHILDVASIQLVQSRHCGGCHGCCIVVELLTGP
jgi:hypothetical protein